MGFVLKARLSVGRTTLFGIPTMPTPQIGENLREHFQKCMRSVRKLEYPTTSVFPLKKLRSQLIHILACDVAFQPSAGLFVPKGQKVKTFTNNPIWDMAPRGAFYKARRLCSLSQPLVTHGWKNPAIVHELVRLSINIWRMPKVAFNGLCRKIQAMLGNPPKVGAFRKRPDALEHFRMLSKNPVISDCVYWYTGYQRPVDGDPPWRSMIASSKLGLVRQGLYLRYKRQKS